MFTLDELKNINKNYIYWTDTKELKLRSQAKDDASVKKTEEMTQEERNKIISAIYVLQVIKGMSQGIFGTKGKEEQEALDEIQTEFYREALTPGKKMATLACAMSNSAKDKILGDLVSSKEEVNNMAEIYLQYILNENGKKAMNIQRGIEGKMAHTITYDITNLEKKNKFIKSLNPNNPMYTQPPKMQILTPEQKANRRAYVEKAIQYYNMMEHDEWYQYRVEKEDEIMQRVARIVNNHEQMMPVKNEPGLFYLLKAAQNLSITGEKDFLEEIISQPEVNKTLLEFKTSEQAKKMKSEAQENEKNGKVNADGLLSGHHMTYGERLHKEANEYISKHSNAVTFAKKLLNERSSFPLEYGNSELTQKSKVIELVARTQGKYTNRTRNSEGNIVLQVSDGKEQVK